MEPAPGTCIQHSTPVAIPPGIPDIEVVIPIGFESVWYTCATVMDRTARFFPPNL